MAPDTTDASRGGTRDERLTRRAAAVAMVLFALLLWWLFSQFARVPDVKGLTEEGARFAIEQAGFEVGAISEHASVESAGSISDQTPSAGRWTLRGNEVALVKSLGDRSEEPAEDVSSATIFDTDMNWDTVFPLGERVIIPDDRPEYEPQLIDYGPQVPGVQGLTEATAVAALKAAGYGIEASFGPSTTGLPAGTVFYQDPPPGMFEPEGTVVVIKISTGPPLDD